ncbi:MAG: hypothetical protein HY778_10605 [Betaproteobacteria bacterium]|nr:hypothetical protein [Betaproteobacteria bacterium]
MKSEPLPPPRALGLAAMLCVLLVAGGCATPSPAPRIDRLPPDEARRLGLDAPRPLTLDEVVALAAAGTPPQEIVRRIDASAGVYHLSRIEEQTLRQHGVPEEVIAHMNRRHRAEEARRRALEQQELARRRYAHDPWWPHYRPYDHPFGPYPGVSIGIGVGHWSPRWGLHWGVGIGHPLFGW